MAGYLLSHYTLLGCCRRGVRGRVLVTMAAVSAVNMLLYFSSVWWAGVIVSPVICLGWLAVESIAHSRKESKEGSSW